MPDMKDPWNESLAGCKGDHLHNPPHHLSEIIGASWRLQAQVFGIVCVIICVGVSI